MNEKIGAKIVKLEKIDVNLNDLANFLVEAKKNGYASGKGIIKLPSGLEQVQFQKGLFHFTDTWSGHYKFGGNEIVRLSGSPIWVMNYYGGMLPEFLDPIPKKVEEFIFDKELTKKSYEFLREALLQVNADAPFRGPVKVDPLHSSPDIGFYKDEQKGLIYTNSLDGGVRNFRGSEKIETGAGKMLYSLKYHGGLIVQK